MRKETQFIDFLRMEIYSKKWTPAELARKINLSKGYLSDVLNQKKKPTYKLCTRLAPILGYSQEFLLKKANLIEEEEQKKDAKEIIELFNSLSASRKEILKHFIRTLILEQSYDEKE